MILADLVKWWEIQPGGLPPGYQPAFLTKKIVLTRDGTAPRLVPIGNDSRGSRTGLSWEKGVPRVKRSGTAPKPSLLADNAVYTLGLVREKDKPQDVAAKHAAFVDLVRECAEATKEPAVQAVLSFLESSHVAELRDDPTLQPVDDLVFEVDGRFVTELPAVRTFWADRVSPKEGGVIGTCLVTGATTTIAERHPYKIKGVPGGQAQGTDLISVNNASGESYGHHAALNSPVGTGAAESICNGLNALLSLDKHHLRVSETAYVWWVKTGETFPVNDYLGTPDAEIVGQLFKSIEEGGIKAQPREKDFFALALSNNVSRTVIRAEFSLTLLEAKRNLAQWFKRLELVALDGDRIRPPGVYALATSLYRDKGDVPKRVPVALVEAAIGGRPPSRELLQIAVRRNRVEGGPFQTFRNQRYLATTRLALTRAILVGAPHLSGLTPMLNPDLENEAYQCGRLLSVLESIQRVAIPNLNATLTDKHYSAAAASPGLIFGVLLKDAVSAHLPKLRKNRRGAYLALDTKLQEILAKLTKFPTTLDYEEQGLFSLGYYHQKAADVAAARARTDLAEIAEDVPATTEA